MTNKTKDKVFVTGISGWIAQYCAIELLKAGYLVKGSLRTMSRQPEVINAIAKEIDPKDKLEFCELDLTKDKGWDTAMNGCTYLLHIASPFIVSEPKNENELITPAKEGTLRALRAAQKSKVKRVILTSSIVAMSAHQKSGKFTPESWTDMDPKNKINAYQKSKTIAEKAAWDFIKNQTGDHKLEMSTINPGAVLGPALSQDIQGASLDICSQLLTGKMPGIPNLTICMVDVRDVAKHHVLAMQSPKINKRYISASAKPIPFMRLAETLKKNGYKVPTNKVPTFLLKILSLIDPQAKAMLSLIDKKVECDNSETIKDFNWKPIPLEKTFLDMAKSVKEVLKK